MAAQSASESSFSYLSASQAAAIDEQLMGSLGFTLEQLMELAGLSVASACHEVYPAARAVLVLCGPGNNGGDGLVAARHLHHFGHAVSVCLPKRGRNPFYVKLETQLSSLRVPFISVDEAIVSLRDGDAYSLVVDALFGFSFKGDLRPPFDALVAAMSSPSAPPVASVDVPSGWDVDAGDASGDGLKPSLLVSLTAPKQGVRGFKGAHHYLGGRFVPPSIVEEFSLRMPSYSGSAQCVRIGGAAAAPTAAASAL